jgi:hypothetical protein
MTASLRGPYLVVALHEMAKYIWRAKKAEGEDCRNANGEQRLSRNLAERGGGEVLANTVVALTRYLFEALAIEDRYNPTRISIPKK